MVGPNSGSGGSSQGTSGGGSASATPAGTVTSPSAHVRVPASPPNPTLTQEGADTPLPQGQVVLGHLWTQQGGADARFALWKGTVGAHGVLQTPRVFGTSTPAPCSRTANGTLVRLVTMPADLAPHSEAAAMALLALSPTIPWNGQRMQVRANAAYRVAKLLGTSGPVGAGFGYVVQVGRDTHETLLRVTLAQDGTVAAGLHALPAGATAWRLLSEHDHLQLAANQAYQVGVKAGADFLAEPHGETTLREWMHRVPRRAPGSAEVRQRSYRAAVLDQRAAAAPGGTQQQADQQALLNARLALEEALAIRRGSLRTALCHAPLAAAARGASEEAAHEMGRLNDLLAQLVSNSCLNVDPRLLNWLQRVAKNPRAPQEARDLWRRLSGPDRAAEGMEQVAAGFENAESVVSALEGGPVADFEAALDSGRAFHELGVLVHLSAHTERDALLHEMSELGSPEQDGWSQGLEGFGKALTIFNLAVRVASAAASIGQAARAHEVEREDHGYAGQLIKGLTGQYRNLGPAGSIGQVLREQVRTAPRAPGVRLLRSWLGPLAQNGMPPEAELYNLTRFVRGVLKTMLTAEAELEGVESGLRAMLAVPSTREALGQLVSGSETLEARSSAGAASPGGDGPSSASPGQAPAGAPGSGGGSSGSAPSGGDGSASPGTAPGGAGGTQPALDPRVGVQLALRRMRGAVIGRLSQRFHEANGRVQAFNDFAARAMVGAGPAADAQAIDALLAAKERGDVQAVEAVQKLLESVGKPFESVHSFAEIAELFGAAGEESALVLVGEAAGTVSFWLGPFVFLAAGARAIVDAHAAGEEWGLASRRTLAFGMGLFGLSPRERWYQDQYRMFAFGHRLYNATHLAAQTHGFRDAILEYLAATGDRSTSAGWRHLKGYLVPLLRGLGVAVHGYDTDDHIHTALSDALNVAPEAARDHYPPRRAGSSTGQPAPTAA